MTTHRDDCIFCKIVAGEIPCFKLWEDDRALSFMDINPYNDGHCLVITKAHTENLFATEDADLAACIAAAKRVAGAVDAALSPDGINLVQANGPAAGQSVFHFHIHIFPRAADDRAMMNWAFQEGDMARVGDLAERIREALG